MEELISISKETPKKYSNIWSNWFLFKLTPQYGALTELNNISTH